MSWIFGMTGRNSEASILEKYSSQEIWMMQELFDRTADVLEKNPNQIIWGNFFRSSSGAKMRDCTSPLMTRRKAQHSFA